MNGAAWVVSSTPERQLIVLILICARSSQTADYLEATVYSKEKAVIMVGNFADLPPGQEHKVNDRGTRSSSRLHEAGSLYVRAAKGLGE